jgi:hypothetical protein
VLVSVLAIVSLLSSVVDLLFPATLTLTREGYTVSYPLRHVQHRWVDVERFGIWDLRRKGMSIGKSVAVRLRDQQGSRYSGNLLNRKLSGGFDDTLRGTYGMPAEDLLALMQEWQTKHAEPQI